MEDLFLQLLIVYSMVFPKQYLNVVQNRIRKILRYKNKDFFMSRSSRSSIICYLNILEIGRKELFLITCTILVAHLNANRKAKSSRLGNVFTVFLVISLNYFKTLWILDQLFSYQFGFLQV